MSPRTSRPPHSRILAGAPPSDLVPLPAGAQPGLTWRGKGLRGSRRAGAPPTLQLAPGPAEAAAALEPVASAAPAFPSAVGGCDHCGCTQSPQWRKGPAHKPVLCNACGARFLRTHRLDNGPASDVAPLASRSLAWAAASDEQDTAQTPPPKKAAARAAIAAEAAARASALAAAAGARATAAVAAAAAAAAASAPRALALQQPRRPMRARVADGTALCAPPPPPHCAPLRRLSNSAAQLDADAPVSPVRPQAGPASRVVPFSPGPAAAANVLLMLLAAASGDDAGAALGGESGGENEEDAAAAAAAQAQAFQRRRSSNAGALRAAASRATAKRPWEAPADADAPMPALPSSRLPMPMLGASPRKRPRARSPTRNQPVARPAVARRPAAMPAAPMPLAAAAIDPAAAVAAPLFRQKAHRPWSLLEVAALVEGVAHYGRGQWADIKALDAPFQPASFADSMPLSVAAALALRSAVDLKDKWRNLLRVATGPAADADVAAPAKARREAASDLPAALLSRVRSLAAARSSPPPPAARAPAAAAPSASAASVEGDDAMMMAPADVMPSKTAGGGGGARRSKHHSPWTLAEATALVDGVARAGGCRWTIVLKLSESVPGAPLARRSAIDLKDKWRNLLALAQLPAAGRRRAAETPSPLLQRVLELETRYGVARRRGRRGGPDVR